MGQLEVFLKRADLYQFHDAFVSAGVDEHNIMDLSMQDYSLFGVSTMSDRKRLFQLIQVLKRNSEESTIEVPSQSSHATTVVPPPSPSPPVLVPASAPSLSSPSVLRVSQEVLPESNVAWWDEQPTAHFAITGASSSSITSIAKSDGNSTSIGRSTRHISRAQQSIQQSTKQTQKQRPTTAGSRSRGSSLSSRTSGSKENNYPAPYTSDDGTINMSNSPIRSRTTSFEVSDRDYNGKSNDDNSVTGSTSGPSPLRRAAPQNLNAYGGHSERYKHALAVDCSIMDGGNFHERIRVCVRKRPLSQKERLRRDEDVVTVADRHQVLVDERKTAVDLTRYVQSHRFFFDETFGSNDSNDEVYRRTAQPLLAHVFNKGKATCFAYGQTGAGKTHTMMGSRRVVGLYVLAARDIFALLRSNRFGNLRVCVSYFEIYCGQLFDLLHSRTRLHAREDGQQRVCIAGLQEREVTSVEELMRVIELGNSSRSTGSTGVNADSSRSHAVLQIDLKRPTDVEVQGRISFIDLAGSERAADTTDNDRQTRLEGAEINTSLLALKECIRALDQDQKHTPFRQSKLTQVLKDSFIGNSRTCMISCISPNAVSTEHSLNTLRYADRVKELKNNSCGSTGGKNQRLIAKEEAAQRIVEKQLREQKLLEQAEAEEMPANASLNNHETPTATLEYGAHIHRKLSEQQNSNTGIIDIDRELSSSPLFALDVDYVKAGVKKHKESGKEDEEQDSRSRSQKLSTHDLKRDMLVSTHRSHMEESNEILRLKKFMGSALAGDGNEDGNPVAPIDLSTYAEQMDAILTQQMELLQSYRTRLQAFKRT